MRQKIKEQRWLFMEFILLIAIFVILFISPAREEAFVVAVCFAVSAALLLFAWRRAQTRTELIIRRMTDAVSTLPDSLSPKDYAALLDETRLFFEELEAVKAQLFHKSRIRQELLDIASTVASNMDFDSLLAGLLPKLNEATRSLCSAFYVANPSTQKMEIKHSVGFSKNLYGEFDITLGEGMVGAAAMKQDITIYTDIPEDTVFSVRSFLGKIKPRSVMAIPVQNQGQTVGVLVCASVFDYTKEERGTIELIRHYLGIAVNNGLAFDRAKRLSNELNFQNKLIQDQHMSMKNKLEEKTQLLNYVVGTMREDCLYALNTQGTVLLWNRCAESLYGIPAAQALGSDIERICADAGWPSVAEALEQTLAQGTYEGCFWHTPAPDADPSEGRRYYKMTMTCLYSDARQPIGAASVLQECSP